MFTSRVVRFDIEIDFEREGGVQVCIQRLTLNCETDEFEERINPSGMCGCVRVSSPFQSC